MGPEISLTSLQLPHLCCETARSVIGSARTAPIEFVVQVIPAGCYSYSNTWSVPMCIEAERLCCVQENVVKTATYSMEFQRGVLPIGHILLFLDTKNRRHTPRGINYARSTCGERYCMHLLLNHVEGPSCFGEVKKIKR
ncbi:hypothetical protein ACHQM5_017273 [Ranunculus cassubicifolius]